MLLKSFNLLDLKIINTFIKLFISMTVIKRYILLEIYSILRWQDCLLSLKENPLNYLIKTWDIVCRHRLYVFEIIEKANRTKLGRVG